MRIYMGDLKRKKGALASCNYLILQLPPVT